MKLTKDNITKTKGKFKPKAILVLVDELSEVMNDTNYKLVSSIQNDLGSIARLGRAAGCHLGLATQRPSSNVINADLKNNIQMGCLLGDFDSGASTLIFDKDVSDLSKPEIKGRGFIKSGKEIIEFQSYWTTKEKDFTLKIEEPKESNKEKIDEETYDADGDDEKQKLIDELTRKNINNQGETALNEETVDNEENDGDNTINTSNIDNEHIDHKQDHNDDNVFVKRENMDEFKKDFEEFEEERKKMLEDIKKERMQKKAQNAFSSKVSEVDEIPGFSKQHNIKFVRNTPKTETVSESFMGGTISSEETAKLRLSKNNDTNSGNLNENNAENNNNNINNDDNNFKYKKPLRLNKNQNDAINGNNVGNNDNNNKNNVKNDDFNIDIAE